MITLRIIVGISGASGVILGYKLLQALRRHEDVESHVVISAAAQQNFALETTLTLPQVRQLADYCYENHDMAARIASGSFVTDGMVIIPCSMKTLAAVACGYADTLLARAADVCLKENRRVVLAPREMPLGKIHLRNLLSAADLGCAIVPPMLTFYHMPHSIDEQIDHIIGKILRQFGLEHAPFRAWAGAPGNESES